MHLFSLMVGLYCYFYTEPSTVHVIQHSQSEAEIIIDHTLADLENPNDEYEVILTLPDNFLSHESNTAAPSNCHQSNITIDSLQSVDTMLADASTSSGQPEVAMEPGQSSDLPVQSTASHPPTTNESFLTGQSELAIEGMSNMQQDPVGPSSQSNRDAAKRVLMQIVGPVKAVNARTRKRKTEKATVLTGSPYKNFLESKVEKGRKQDKGDSGPEKKKKCEKSQRIIAERLLRPDLLRRMRQERANVSQLETAMTVSHAVLVNSCSVKTYVADSGFSAKSA
jgi:hypothetical protein